MERRTFLTTILAQPLVLAQPLAAQDTVKLRYTFHKGEVLRWNVEQILKMKTVIAGKEEIVETTSKSAKIWKTVSVDGTGTAVFEYSVDDVDMYQKQTGRNDAAYNSKTDKDIPAAFINLEGKVGVPLAHITITPLGETTKKPLRIYAGSAYSENKMAILLPEKPITVGGDWTEPVPKELTMPDRTVKKIKTQLRYTLNRYQTGLAVFKLSSQVLTPLQPKDELQLVDCYAAGTIEFDLDAGHLFRQSRTVNRSIVGIQGNSDLIEYEARWTEVLKHR